MPVQEEVIPYLLGIGNDVIALAQTGTGKTAAYGIPLLQKINPEEKTTQALILSPTRELCLQISDDLKDFSKYMTGVRIVPVYGGTSIVNQINALRKGVQIIVATPGRLIDLMNRGVAQLTSLRGISSAEARRSASPSVRAEGAPCSSRWPISCIKVKRRRPLDAQGLSSPASSRMVFPSRKNQAFPPPSSTGTPTLSGAVIPRMLPSRLRRR